MGFWEEIEVNGWALLLEAVNKSRVSVASQGAYVAALAWMRGRLAIRLQPMPALVQWARSLPPLQPSLRES